jgi:hypothetical protein
MNKLLALAGLMLGFGAMPPAGAQETPVALPAGMKWTVEISRPEPARAAAPERPDDIVREENAAGDGLRKEERIFRDGSRLTRYAVGDLIVYFDPRTNRVEVDEAGQSPFGGPLSLKGLSEFRWVRSAFLAGQKTVGGMSCDVYRKEWSPGLQSGDGAGRPAGKSPGQMTACINRETRLPVQLETPLEIRRYSFSPLPAPLALPSEYQAALDRRAAALKWRRQRFANPDAPR